MPFPDEPFFPGPIFSDMSPSRAECNIDTSSMSPCFYYDTSRSICQWMVEKLLVVLLLLFVVTYFPSTASNCQTETKQLIDNSSDQYLNSSVQSELLSMSPGSPLLSLGQDPGHAGLFEACLLKWSSASNSLIHYRWTWELLASVSGQLRKEGGNICSQRTNIYRCCTWAKDKSINCTTETAPTGTRGSCSRLSVNHDRG